MNLPHAIKNENDLKLFEEYLKKEPMYRPKPPASKPSPLVDLRSFLKSHMGHVIKVEFPVGARLENKIGKLNFVGADYLELIQNGGSIIAVSLSPVISVNVIGTFNK